MIPAWQRLAEIENANMQGMALTRMQSFAKDSPLSITLTHAVISFGTNISTYVPTLAITVSVTICTSSSKVFLL